MKLFIFLLLIATAQASLIDCDTLSNQFAIKAESGLMGKSVNCKDLYSAITILKQINTTCGSNDSEELLNVLPNVYENICNRKGLSNDTSGGSSIKLY